MNELLDIIDNDGKIIGTMTREEAYKRNEALQISGVLVFRTNGHLLLQKRGKNKRYPLCYDYSAAGHVLSGENFLNAAKRELKEELNISKATLFAIGTVKAFDSLHAQKLRKLHKVFWTVNDSPVDIFKDELEGVEEFSQEVLDKRISEHPNQFTPTFVKVYTEIIKNKNLFSKVPIFYKMHEFIRN